MKPEYRIVQGEKGHIQKVLNQWLATGYDVAVEAFILSSPGTIAKLALYTAVIRRWKI